MKSSTKRMSFRIWVYFLVLTGVMLLFLWMMQISFIGPYYERNRTQTIYRRVSEVEALLERQNPVNVDKIIARLLAQENMCGSIYNSQGGRIMLMDDIGNNCHLKSLSDGAVAEYMTMARQSPSKDFSIRFNSELFEQGMFFYGKEVMVNKEPMYIYINTPIELLDSTVFVLKRQFGIVALAVFSFATFVTFILSRRLSQPISNITENAQRLARGDLSVSFDEDEYAEVKTLSRTLNYATEEFRKTDELRRDLVANVSHDIKTPLTMIKAYAEMIQDISGDNPKMRHEHLKVIVDEVNHLERLVNDMLTLSKYESKVFDVKESEFNLFDQIQSTVKLFVGMEYRFKVQVDKGIFVIGDEIKMGQILYNYINNATKYAAEGLITIEATVNDSEIVVAVCDEGPGMEPEITQKIWDRYYKIDKNYQRSDSSSGLGLSIVKAIAEATGSRVWVESTVGEGARFFYTLRPAPIFKQKFEKKGEKRIKKQKGKQTLKEKHHKQSL